MTARRFLEDAATLLVILALSILIPVGMSVVFAP